MNTILYDNIVLQKIILNEIMKKSLLLLSFIFTIFSVQLFTMNENIITLNSICYKNIEMVNITLKKECEQKIAQAKIKTAYHIMIQSHITNNKITRENAEKINKECSQYNLYQYLIPVDRDQNSEFHCLIYKQSPVTDQFKLLCPSIFEYLPNKYGCTANSIIATNKKGLCYDLNKKHQE